MKKVQSWKKVSTVAGGVLLALGMQTAQAQDDEVTYNTHVAKILNENCVVCHQEGGIGPMQLSTFEQVRPWAPLIQLRVAQREMPPYAYDHGIGIQDLQADWRLDQEEIDTVVAWVNAGSPLGPQDVIPPAAVVRDANEWNFAPEFGQPDLIIPSAPLDIPANGNDMWSKEYVATGLNVDRCIKAVQVKPRGDARAVVHHANSSVFTENEFGELERYGQLTEYAMGKWGEVPSDGVCRTMPADSTVLWDIHMFPGGVGATAEGEMIRDNVVEIGVWFHEEGYENTQNVYKQDLALYGLRDGYEGGELIVPPHGYAMTQGFHSFDHPVRIDSFQPHGHLRMNAASLEVFYPERGRTERISQISNWSATWHHSHLYEPDAAPLLPTGAVLVIKQWYDNTADNPNNPDPDQWVVGGSRTGDEMSHAWIAVTHLDDDGYDEMLADRKDKEDRALAGND
ncbi:MAG: cytochrome c [Gammaproteobacteria bacterium]|nr:cytochrome c [Gammaproteobacteria bacterium]